VVKNIKLKQNILTILLPYCHFLLPTILFKSKYFKVADLQMLKNEKNDFLYKINSKYSSSYVQWRNLLLLTPQLTKSLVKHRY